MLEPCGDERFPMKSRFAPRVGGEEFLDRNIAAQVLIVRTRHTAQTAAPVLADDPIPLGIVALPGRAQTHVPARSLRELITGASRVVRRRRGRLCRYKIAGFVRWHGKRHHIGDLGAIAACTESTLASREASAAPVDGTARGERRESYCAAAPASRAGIAALHASHAAMTQCTGEPSTPPLTRSCPALAKALH
jgi:hypothetical protein